MKLLSFSFAWLFTSALCLICVLPNGIVASQSPAAAVSADYIALPEGKQNVEYEFRFESEGGAAPISWRLVGGELPPGLTLDASGRLHGVPSTVRREAYKFIVEAADSAAMPQRATQTFLLLIQTAPLRIKNPNGLRIQPPHTPGASTPTPSSVPGVSDPGAVVGLLASSKAPPATSGPGASISTTGSPSGPQTGRQASLEDDARENFDASGFIGVGVDSFAAGEIKRVLNRGDSSGQKERFVGGFDFAYRLFGDPAKNVEGGWWKNKSQQLWLYGGTTHGVRSADVDCSANSDVCKDVFDVTATPQRFFYVLRNASSLEAFMGARWEFAQMNRVPALSSARAYLKAQAGFLTVRDGIDDVYDIHHVAAGLIATNGRFRDSYVELGFGRTDLFTENRRRRFKIDGLLSWDIPGMPVVRPFAQIKVDTDLGRGSDSVQSYFGFDFDLSRLFGGAEKAGK
jgi:hypothetical protein